MTRGLRRSLTLATGLTLVASALTVLAGTAPASATTALADCGGTPVAPCVLSVKRNGADITAPYGYIGWYGTVGGSKDIYFLAEYNGSDELTASALTDSWRVEIFVGSWETPRVTHGKGRNVKVVRSHGTDGYTVTITATPVTVSGQCDGSGYCPEDWVPTTPEFNNKEWAGYLDLYITDYGAWSDPAQRADFYGMDYFTNIAYTELPPQIAYPADPSLPPYLLINAANRRFRADRTTLVEGHSELRIPNRFLSGVYGVPDPTTMTSSGIVVGGDGGASVSVSQEGSGTAMRIVIDHMHFPNVSGPAPSTAFAGPPTAAATKSSLRHVKYRVGTITPTRPKNVKAKRVSAHRAKVRFDRSHPRGARVRGYVVKCTIGSGGSFVKASNRRPPVVVKGLKAHHRYVCKVRAKSKAGPSRWSAPAKLRARP